MPSLLIDTEKCNQCGFCATECPLNIIELMEIESSPRWTQDGETLCIHCGHCVTVCPTGAITLDTIRPEDCQRVRRDALPSPEQVELFMKSRRSIRVYKPEPLGREMLTRLIDVARYAPTGHNAQLVQWLVIENADEVKRLAGLTADWLEWMISEMPEIAEMMHAPRIVSNWKSGTDVITRGAPHMVIAHINREIGQLGDCQIALAHLELAAHALGVGACWAGYVQLAASMFPPMIEVLRLPEGNQSFGAMMLGYPAHRFLRIPPRNAPAIEWR